MSSLNTICKALNTYMFQKVWNEPHKNDKRTVKLNSLMKGSRTGSFVVSSHTIKLPNPNEPYYIYYIKSNKLDYRDFDLELGKWKSVKDINNSKYFLTFVNKGKVLYRDKIHFYYYQPSGDIIIAVSKKMMLKINGSVHDYLATRLSIYYDWDLVDNISFKTIKIETQTDLIKAWNYCSNPNKTNVFLNGEKKLNIVSGNLKIGDYLEVVEDPNVKINFNIDLTVDEQKRVFLNSFDDKLYSICHIPKSLNPTNKLYTTNVVEIFVFPKNPTGTVASGLYLFSSTMKLKQITHNDFAVPEDLLTAYGVLIGTEEIILNIQVRENSNTNTLVRDKNYIDLLYRHSDDKILQFLEGQGSTILSFWTADNLANSKYVKYMTSVPTFIDASNINTFVDTFGYQYVLSLLTDNVRKFTFTDHIKYPFVVKKPVIYNGAGLNVLLYINGIKIDYSLLTLNDINEEYMTVGLTNLNFKPSVGDEIIIELVDKVSYGNYILIPNNTNNSITLPSADYKVYKINSIASPVKGVDTTFNRYYTPISESLYTITKVSDGYKFSFVYSAFNSPYVLMPTHGSYWFRKNLSTTITNKGPIFLTLTQTCVNAGSIVPPLNIQTTKVFLNGKNMVEGIDYKLVYYKYLDKVCGMQIVVYNKLAVNIPGTNVLEVLVSRNESEKNYKFFLSEEENVIESSYTWFDSIGTVSVDGKQVLKSYNTNDGILVDETHRSGGLVESVCMYPKQSKSFIDTFKSTEADERHDILVSYFNNIKTPNIGIITIPYPHELYSIKTAVILRDLINNTISFTLDPDNDKMKEKIASYSYLDIADIINDNIDKRFIDFYPCYTDITVVNETVYKLVDYISKLLITDPLTYGGVS